MHETPIQLRFRDMDAMGHVNNAVFATYLEYARYDWYRARFGVGELADFPFILARIEIDYRRPITPNAQPVVAIWVASIGKSSWTFGYRIFEASDTEVTYADATSVQVAYNYREGKKSVLDGDLLRLLEAEMES